MILSLELLLLLFTEAAIFFYPQNFTAVKEKSKIHEFLFNNNPFAEVRMNSQLNISMHCPNPGDATSFYRGIGPFAALRKQYRDYLHFAFFQETSWSNIKLIDIAFLQRPHSNAHLWTAHLYKKQHVPIWIDYDDLLLDVPAYNPAHEIYAHEKIKSNIKELLSLADVVTVSSRALAEQLEPYSAKIVIVPNAFDEMFIPLLRERQPKPNKIILWRGSATHEEDLDELEEAAIELSEKNASWTWVFVGSKPSFARKMPKNSLVVIKKTLDIMEYHELLVKTSPAIAVVPLASNDFNSCKSDCAFLEATFAGSVVIAPEFQKEFHAEHTIKYPEEEIYEGNALTNTLGQTIDLSTTQLVDRNLNAWNYIMNERLLSHINKKRCDILDHLRELR